jgi:tetratricopeptide (TPR) repeat protein
MSLPHSALNAASEQIQAGRFAAAETTLRALVGADPGNADAWCYLGIALGQQEKLEDAIAGFQKAIRLRPTSFEAHTNLGITFLKQRRLDDAVRCLRHALALKPDYAYALNGLGNALAELGRVDEAIDALRQTVRIQPNFAEPYINLGIQLKDQEKLSEAAACYQQALRLRPNSVEALVNFGVCLREQGNLPEAIVCFERALQFRPNMAEAHGNWAATLVDTGDIDLALAHYQEALRLRPAYPQAYYGLGELAVQGHYQFTDSQRQQMQALVADEAFPPRDRISLHFINAALYDRDGNYTRAFQHYHAGNDLRQRYFEQRGQAFDVERHRRQVNELIATFTPDYFRQAAVYGVASELPVFIVGMPRSGSSLVEQILASHPEVHGAGELRDIIELTAALPNDPAHPAGLSTRGARITPEWSRTLATRYLQRLAQLGGNAKRVADKLPENYLQLGIIHTLFPNARVIHCRRNALDVCWSCYTQNFHGLSFTTRLEYLGDYYRQYEKIMAHWRTVLPRPMFEVEYEELVHNQEAVSRKLIAFCGLDWDDRCLAFHTTRRVVRTASKLQVRQPLYSHAVGRWRDYEPFLQPLIDALAAGAASTSLTP